MTLITFLVSGNTFTFEEVEIITNNEYILTFSYESSSDGFFKIASFYKQHLAGYSTKED